MVSSTCCDLWYTVRGKDEEVGWEENTWRFSLPLWSRCSPGVTSPSSELACCITLTWDVTVHSAAVSPGWKHGPLMAPQTLLFTQFTICNMGFSPGSQPIIWVSSWWQEVLTKMKADPPLLLKHSFSVRFQNIWGMEPEKRAAPWRERALGFYLAAIASVVAVTDAEP